MTSLNTAQTLPPHRDCRNSAEIATKRVPLPYYRSRSAVGLMAASVSCFQLAGMAVELIEPSLSFPGI